MSRLKTINTSQECIHKYENLKSEKNIFEILLAPLKHAVILKSLKVSACLYNPTGLDKTHGKFGYILNFYPARMGVYIFNTFYEKHEYCFDRKGKLFK
jgi:aspartate/tyrosine/aromatic aminotransferase